MNPTKIHRENQLEDKIDALLPQIQCGACGFKECLPYARAIVSGNADINQCHPGGQSTITSIAELLGRESIPLDNEYGTNEPPKLAVVDEETCIGCVKCIKACPVDAIIGAAKQMHSILPTICTGCCLCVEPCPLGCISMQISDTNIDTWTWPKILLADKEQKQHHADKLRSHFLNKKDREKNQKITGAEKNKKMENIGKAEKQSYIAKAVARTRKKRHQYDKKERKFRHEGEDS